MERSAPSDFTLTFGNQYGESMRLAPSSYGFVDTTATDEEPEEYELYLTGEEGLWGGTPSDHQSLRVPFEDGERLVDVVMEPKPVTIHLEVRATDYAGIEVARRKLSRIFDPKRPTMINYRSLSEQKVLVVHADHVPDFPLELLSADKTSQGVTINARAYNPYWQSIELKEENMTAFRPLFEFTSEWWDIPNQEFEVGIESTERSIVNDGEGAVPVTIKFYGPAESPYVLNKTTGERIQVNTNLDYDDVLVIDTGAPSVEINGENAFHLLDLDSVFWQLREGENIVTYAAGEGFDDATVDITWRTNYNSI